MAPKSTPAATPLPQLGQEWPGIPRSAYAGVSTDREGKLYAVVLLPDRGEGLKWKAAGAWAKKLEADLPSRSESLLLFQNVRALLPKTWCWTGEECDFDASFAWYCDFSGGDVFNDDRSSEGGALAVRRFPLESFDPFEGLTKRAGAGTAALRDLAAELVAACDAADAAIERASA